MTTRLRAELPTWLALLVCYGLYTVLTVYAAALPFGIEYIALAFVLAFHSSLQHETIHGHPTQFDGVNEALVFLPLGLAFPYRRYRDTHLAHHNDNCLTDPYDDPESWYLDPDNWNKMSRPMRTLLAVNNCLIGRMLIGPGLGFVRFVLADARLIANGRADVAGAWVLHLIGGAIVIWWITARGMWLPGYLLACYFGLSLINLRSFLEHRAEMRVRGRSAVVEDGGLLSILFLNNNLHAVHHAHPTTPWFALPDLYRQHRERFLQMNGGYVLPSYWTVFRRYGIVAKESPAHPLMINGKMPDPAASAE